MNYEKLSLEELEELFLQQREHHYALTEAVRNSRDTLASIMNAVTAKRKQADEEVIFDQEVEHLFQLLRKVSHTGECKAPNHADDALVYAKPGEAIRKPEIFREWSPSLLFTKLTTGIAKGDVT